jgi:uncharacterized cupin superfamily protein
MLRASERMKYVRTVDPAKYSEAGARVSLFDAETGANTCAVSWHKTPPGGGSIDGLHTHKVDQLFFVLSGTLMVEVAGETHAVRPGTLVVFPAGTPHRNWNESDDAAVYLAINAPLPALDTRFTEPVTSPDRTQRRE